MNQMQNLYNLMNFFTDRMGIQNWSHGASHYVLHFQYQENATCEKEHIYICVLVFSETLTFLFHVIHSMSPHFTAKFLPSSFL